MDKSSKTYSQHFRKEWLRDERFENWLMPIEGDSLKCLCKCCKSVLWAKLSDIDRHRKTRKHLTRCGELLCPDETNRLFKGSFDEEKLISLVKEHTELYDGKHHDKAYVADLWKQVAAELGITDSEAKKKWGVLRGNYIQEKRSSDTYSSWPLFESLSFLDSYLKQFSSKISITNSKQMILESINKAELISIEEDVYNPTEGSKTLNSDTSTSSNNETYDKPAKIKDGATSKILWYLRQLTDKTADDKDTDFLFLRSLLPMIKKLGTVENLEFREEIIQILKQKLQRQSNTICFTPNSNSVSIRYGDQQPHVTTPVQTRVDNATETIIIYP